MSQTVVVGLKLPKAYHSLYFKDQLALLEVKIKELTQTLKKEHPEAEEWIITWHEYGLMNTPHDQFINSAQKAQFKSVMRKLTKEEPKLNILAGSVATKRWIDLDNEELANRKIADITEAYKENIAFDQNSQFKAHQEASETLTNDSFYQTRNTAYMFSNGFCRMRHGKITPFQENKTLANGIFKPGANRSQKNVFTAKVGLEICFEHRLGVMAKKLSQESRPLLQIVQSDSASISPKHCVSPYVAHVDTRDPLALITEIPPKKCNVALFSYDIFSNESKLQPVVPQTMHDFVLEKISREIGACSDNLDMADYFSENQSKAILTIDETLSLLSLAASKYIENCKIIEARIAAGENGFYQAESPQQKKLEKLQPCLEFLLLKVEPAQLNEAVKADIEGVLRMAIKEMNTQLVKKIVRRYGASLENIFHDEALLERILADDDVKLFDILYGDKLKNDLCKGIMTHHSMLHLALKHDAKYIIKMIMRNDPDLSVKNAEGQTVLDIIHKMKALSTGAEMVLRHANLENNQVKPDRVKSYNVLFKNIATMSNLPPRHPLGIKFV